MLFAKGGAKMKLTVNYIKDEFYGGDFTKGSAYYREGRVTKYQEISSGNTVTVLGIVRGSFDYKVRTVIAENNLVCFCSCPKYEITGRCKHIVALLLSYCEKHDGYEPQKPVYRSDRWANSLMESYKNYAYEENSASAAAGSARLIPQIIIPNYYYDGYPEFSFKVGYDRLYVIKNLTTFVRNSAAGKIMTFGKNLTMNVSVSEFDERSQEIIPLISDEADRFEEINKNYYYFSGKVNSTVQFTGNAFDKLFMLFEGEEIPVRSGANIRLTNGNPKLTVMISQTTPELFRVIFPELLNKFGYFGNSQRLYIIFEDVMYRCTADFRAKMLSLLKLGNFSMEIATADMPRFCSSVLPLIEKYVEITAGRECITEFLPDECTPCFYFDINDDGVLTADLKFRYDDAEYSENEQLPQTVKKNSAAESKAIQIVEKYFDEPVNRGLYTIEDEERIYKFLTESITEFYNYGEVYATDRLTNRQMKPPKLNVGVSVSDGILNLDFNTGEFPVQELEALYASMVTGKKYHRLKDGRYLTLDGSAYETLAETAHMMQLSPEQLSSGHAELPAFRAPYADSLLSGKDNVEINRSNTFKSMIRSFKTVEDSDFEVPAALSGILRSYQKVGYRWLKTLSQYGFGGILADEMGLGKTLQVITFLSSVYEAEAENVQAKPSIVVCPSSLVLNWADEFDKFAPNIKYSLVNGTAASRKNVIASIGTENGCNVAITSYDLLKRDIGSYKDREFYCCVLDEGQYIKNSSTLASKSVKQINCTQRFVMTGTPIENRLSELWNLFDFLMPGYLYTQNKFTEKLEKPIVKSGDAAARERLSGLVKPFILRRLKADVLKELPPKVEYVRRIALSESERKVYAAAVLAAQNKINGTKLEILAALTKLRQICCNPALCCENYGGETSKLDACVELCKENVENGHQILLFSQFTTALDIIRTRLENEGVSTFTIQGSTPKEQRAQLVKDFNAGGANVFLISLKAGGTGLNLTAADVVIHYDPWWNIAAQNQATDRAHRIGQKSCVNVYKLIAEGTIEERILELQKRKADLMDVLSDSGNADIMHMSKEDLLSLCSL